MSSDATFEQGGERAIRLRAESSEDLTVISSLVQDAVGKTGNVHYAPRRRRLSLLLYRFRWEDKPRADREKRTPERVAAALTIDDCIRVRSAKIDPRDREKVLNLLSLSFDGGEDGTGLLTLTCSAGASLQAQVECVNVGLVDLTRPWAAGGTPQHFG
ncbi:MAG: DUF2948 family protein [Pseudomonadota bacterium]